MKPEDVPGVVVADILRHLEGVSEPERETGRHPKTKAGWVRTVVAAAVNAGYAQPRPLHPL